MSRILACVLAGGAIAAGGWMHSANAMPNIPLAGAEPTALSRRVTVDTVPVCGAAGGIGTSGPTTVR